MIDKNLAAEKYIVGKKKNVLNAELKNTGSHSDLEKKLFVSHVHIRVEIFRSRVVFWKCTDVHVNCFLLYVYC